MEERKFKIGDKVRYIDDEFYGDIGEIIEERGNVYGVKFENRNSRRHDLEEKCENGHGWWSSSEQLELIEEISTISDLKFADILTLRNGERYVFVDDVMHGEDMSYYCDGDSIDLFDNKDLTRKSAMRKYDIVKVERNGQVIFEREEVKEMTIAKISEALGYKVKVVE